MKNQINTRDLAVRFKKSYSKKMGGKQTIILPNGEVHEFDDREFYSGRGAKYNSSSMHEDLGEIRVSKKDYVQMVRLMKERNKAIYVRQLEQKRLAKRVQVAKNKGVYSIKIVNNCTYVELSEQEQASCTFDAVRLANTFDISVKDALLLNSRGKTYVFATNKSGVELMLYHPNLACNTLSISCEVAEPEFRDMLDHKEWIEAPYANLVGASPYTNHFVC